jgi:hypothetical protein
VCLDLERGSIVGVVKRNRAERKADEKRRALSTTVTAGRDVPAMELHEMANNRQPEAKATVGARH